MLVLSRNKKESIIVNGNIKITIVNIIGKCVRVGIDAPDDVVIIREELIGKTFPRKGGNDGKKS